MMTCDCKGGVCKCSKCIVAKVAYVLVLVGGLNWGLVGLGMLLGSMGGWNLVALIFGSGTLAAIVYLLVGISTVVKIVGCPCKMCKGMKNDAAPMSAPAGPAM
jgi:uncharacterized membrane protein YuzA (DUF378 family)